MSTEKIKPAAQPARATPRSGGSGPIPKMTKYLGEVRTELRKTTWPTRQELIAQTQVVLGLLIVVGVFIAAWDTILGALVSGLFRLLGIEKD